MPIADPKLLDPGVSEFPSSFGNVVLVAGGVGVTHQLLYVRDLIRGYQHRTSPIRRIVLAWAIRYEGKMLIFLPMASFGLQLQV